MSVDTKRLVDTFLAEMEATRSLGQARSLECAVEAVARAVSAKVGLADNVDVKDLRRQLSFLRRKKSRPGPSSSARPVVENDELATVLEATAEVTGIPAKRITGHRAGYKQSQAVSRARFLAFSVLNRIGFQEASIAAHFGMDRTSVWYGLRLVRRDPAARERIESVLAIARERFSGMPGAHGHCSTAADPQRAVGDRELLTDAKEAA